MGHADKLRSTVRGDAGANSREDASAPLHNDSVRNLAYVVNSANDNIVSLQKTVQQQERELGERADRTQALQRNYETLSRIRQADQKEFLHLKAQYENQQNELQELRQAVHAETVRNAKLEERAAVGETAHAELLRLQLRTTDLEREQSEREAEATQARRQSAEMLESNRTLKLALEKMTRVQHEMLQRSRKAEEATRQLAAEKEVAEKAHAAASSRLAVQERQLKTFLEANEALEGDLRSQMGHVAHLERRKQEADAERQTIEAYYEARLEETQAQYNRLLADIDGAKQAAKDDIFRTYSLADNAAVVPADGAPPASPPAS